MSELVKTLNRLQKAAQPKKEVGDGKDATIQTDVIFSKETQKVIIPEGMSKLEAAKDLINQHENEEQVMKFQYIFEGWDWKDALRAFRAVTEERFGWIKGKTTWRSTPTEISIVTGYKRGVKQMENAFYGMVFFPAWDEAEGTLGVTDDGRVYLTVDAKRKYGQVIQTFFKECEQYLTNNSIYKNKPVVVTWGRWMDLEITELKPNDKIVLNDRERVTIDNLIIDQFDEPGKRCYLFTGSYGNGKSETAMLIADAALKHGLSFFYLKSTKAFGKCLSFAKRYEPAIVFVEDIDEIASGEQRDTAMNEILNTLDGVETKGRNLTVIFTTNHEKRINKALRRPGRIDLIVNFENPYPKTQENIMRKFFDTLNGGEELDYSLIIPKVPNVQAAVIAEMAKRAVKMAKRHKDTITTERVLAAVASMEYQIQFMNEDTEVADPVAKAYDLVAEHKRGEVGFKQ